jgi:hypothetical protein
MCIHSHTYINIYIYISVFDINISVKKIFIGGQLQDVASTIITPYPEVQAFMNEQGNFIMYIFSK